MNAKIDPPNQPHSWNEQVRKLLPIRRLNLAIGQQAEVSAAWLRFPSFELEPLSQIYTRLDEFMYRYSSAGGTFIRDLTVNNVRFVTDYPGLWRAEFNPR